MKTTDKPMKITGKEVFVIILFILYIPYLLWIIGTILYVLTEHNIIQNEGLHMLLIQINNSFGDSDPPMWVQWIILLSLVGMLAAVIATTVSLHIWIRDLIDFVDTKVLEEDEKILQEGPRTTRTYSVDSNGTISPHDETGGYRTNWYAVGGVIMWIFIVAFSLIIFPIDAIIWLVLEHKDRVNSAKYRNKHANASLKPAGAPANPAGAQTKPTGAPIRPSGTQTKPTGAPIRSTNNLTQQSGDSGKYSGDFKHRDNSAKRLDELLQQRSKLLKQIDELNKQINDLGKHQ